MERLTRKSLNGYDGYYQDCCDKLGKLEDIEEEIGFEKTGSSLLAFLETPYIKSIMKLYVSARKDFKEELTHEVH